MLDNRLHARLTSGHDYNEVVAEYLRSQGIPCDAPELKFAKTEEEIAWFSAEEKDIILEDGSVIEVKSQTREFTSSPTEFRWDDFIVDTIGYYKKRIKPIAYVFISKKTGGMLALNPAETEHSWWRKTIIDGRDGIPSVSLISSKRNLRTMEALIEYLKQRRTK